MRGFVGGTPSMVDAIGVELRAAGERVASLVEPCSGAARSGVDAAAQGPAMVATARCGAAWARVLIVLADQVTALGQVADAAAADLGAAEGS